MNYSYIIHQVYTHLIYQVYVDSKIHHYVDTSSRVHSNWTRLVRHSSLKEIVNLVVLQVPTFYYITVISH